MAERILTISLRKYLSTQPRNKRSKKAMRYLRERVAHYTKMDLDKVKINIKLNTLMVKAYSRQMLPVKLLVNVDKGFAQVSAFEVKKKEEIKAKPAEATGKTAKSSAAPQIKAVKDSVKKEAASPSAQKP